MGTRLDYLRKRIPQLGADANSKDYQRQLSRALHESERDVLHAFADIDTPPVLKVARITSDQSITAAQLATVEFNSTVIDTHSWWNGSIFAYQPEIQGFYRVSWQVQFDDTAAFAVSSYAMTEVNSTQSREAAFIYGNGTATSLSVGGSTIVECDGINDSIQILGYVSSATAPSMNGVIAPYRTWLTAEYIGRIARRSL